MNKHHIGHTLSPRKKFTLPGDFITQTTAILARKGAGKTYTGRVLAEEVLEQSGQIVAIDPLDVWWGLRLMTGTRKNYNIVIFGGEHADVPLDEKDGKTLARYLSEHRVSAVLSLDHLSKSAQRRFSTDFFEELYRHKSAHKYRTPMHLFIDEADMFAPQRIPRGCERMLGALDTLVRRGRTRGVGITMITQRPAVLNKDVLTQIELMVAMQITSPQDRKAVGEWISVCGDVMTYTPKQVLDMLSSLKRGTGIFWSPAWLGDLKTVAVRKAHTVDSSATPTGAVQKLRKAKRIDLDDIKEALADTIKAAEDDDPRLLKKRIKELEKDLQAKRKPSAPAHLVIVENNLAYAEEEIAILKETIEELSHKLADKQAECDIKISPELMSEELIKHTMDFIARYTPGDNAYTDLKQKKLADVQAAVAEDIRVTGDKFITHKRGGKVFRKEPVPSNIRVEQKAVTSVKRKATCPSDDNLAKGDRAVLSVLAAHGSCDLSKVAMLAGYSPRSSTMRNILSRCRQAEYLTGGGKGPFDITDAGVNALGDPEQLPTGDALRDWWAQKIGGGAPGAVYTALRQGYPGAFTADDIAMATEYSASSSTMRNAFSKLRKLGVIVTENGMHKLSPDVGDA